MHRVEYAAFASDNTAGICPEAMAALAAANAGNAASYGDDEWTAKLCARVREIFETECEVFVVFNGTAANALAVAQLTRSYESVICHRTAHMNTDECGAAELFTAGSKLQLVGGDQNKLDLAEVEKIAAGHTDLHSHRPRLVSLTQATERGTVYTLDEVKALTALARRHKLLVHMDGARFANAVATLGCKPREVTWEAGVDALCFGGTKNGLAAGELVVFFRKELATDFDYRAKQAGQLASKMRFLAAPWLAVLENDVWLSHATHANRCAKKLANSLGKSGQAEILYPVQSDAVFARLPEAKVTAMRAKGWQFFNFFEPDVYRLMCSWATSDETIEAFLADWQRAGA